MKKWLRWGPWQRTLSRNPARLAKLLFTLISVVSTATGKSFRAEGTADLWCAESSKTGSYTGDVLVSMTRPNLNQVAIVTPEFHGAIGSTVFMFCARNGPSRSSSSIWFNQTISLTKCTGAYRGALSRSAPQGHFFLRIFFFLLPWRSSASLRRSKNNSPASTKPSPTSSASRPTSSATKPPSSKPPSKANSPKNGASSIPMSNRPTNCWSGFWPSGARRRGRGSTRSRSGRIRAGCRSCRWGGCGLHFEQIGQEGDANSRNIKPGPHLMDGVP